jgi:hypothetical protein
MFKYDVATQNNASTRQHVCVKRARRIKCHQSNVHKKKENVGEDLFEL